MLQKFKRELKRLFSRFQPKWTRYWVGQSGLYGYGRFAARMACLFSPRYKSQVPLSQLGANGYVSPNAIIEHRDVRMAFDVYLGDRVILFQSYEGGAITFSEGVHLYSDTILETGFGGKITIGSSSHIQPKCSLSAYKGSISIGERVEIAPNCAFYPYNHATDANQLIREQPLISKGDIVIGDDTWLGFGCIILEGVTIGAGAVIGAGSVVTKNIPEMSIAVGSPARVIGHRK